MGVLPGVIPEFGDRFQQDNRFIGAITFQANTSPCRWTGASSCLVTRDPRRNLAHPHACDVSTLKSKRVH